MKHGDLHFFDIGPEQFSCEVDFDCKQRNLWYSSFDNNCFLFGIDLNRGFRTKEACEKYIRHRVKQTCKEMLKDLK